MNRHSLANGNGDTSVSSGSDEDLLKPPRNSQSQLVGGSLTLLASSGLVGVSNLLYNVAMARMLGPAGFAHATAVYTLLMLVSAVTLSFQVVCAKWVARRDLPQEKDAVFAGLHRTAWLAGVFICFGIVAGRHPLASYLNLPDPFLIILLGAGSAFYVPLGARRGYVQGIHAFRSLAVNFVLEGLVRLCGAVVLTWVGLGVRGAVLASVAAVIMAYLFALPGLRTAFSLVRGLAVPFREGLQAIVFFSGQVVINNFDIVLVKHFFASPEAGLYAAISLVGRVVNMCTWSVVHTMFPLSASAQRDEDDGRPVLVVSLLLVSIILACLIVGVWLVPGFVWRMIFGKQFELTGYGTISHLLILYAVTAAIYSLGSVIITYEMSRRIANTGWLQLVFSGVMALGVYLFHATLLQVILVQFVLMLVLFAVLMVPLLPPRIVAEDSAKFARIRKRKPVSEDYVIAEFLKNEFHHPEFNQFRQEFEHTVIQPDLNNAQQNSLRRALLFVRRGAMWRELPVDTKWYEVELTPDDLRRIRFFPRAQWCRMAKGSFYLTDIVERIRPEWTDSPENGFYLKLRSLSVEAREGNVRTGVLLIGADERGPLTILDGNHRVAASMLAEPSTVIDRFHFLCGFSPKMRGCCWYHTNVNTLWRYARNILKYTILDPGPDITDFQQIEL